MSRARFKILAGVFGTAVVGLAAMAQPPVCIPAVQQTSPAPSLPPVLAVQATAPVIPVVKEDVKGAAPKSMVQAGANPPTPTPPPPVIEMPLPNVSPAPVPSTPVVTAQPLPPATLPVGAATLPVPTVVAQAPPVPVPSKPVRVTDTPPSTIPPEPTTSSIPKLEPSGGEVVRSVPPKPSSSTVPTSHDALQVGLKLGDGQPQFEVCRGDDVLLKVVCTGVDVKAPSEKGEPFSVLRASGTVRFTAPGCEGTCEELVVHPVTGDVILTKGVEVKCKLGKGSTTMKAEQMMFKLGTAPAFAVDGPGTITTTSGRR